MNAGQKPRLFAGEAGELDLLVLEAEARVQAANTVTSRRLFLDKQLLDAQGATCAPQQEWRIAE